MWIRRLTFTGFVAFLSAVTASPTDHVVVNLFVTTVKQDSPVQIVGFKLPDKGPGVPISEANKDGAACLSGGYCTKVLLHNTTAKEVKHIVVIGVLGDPRRDDDAEHPRPEMGVLPSSNWKLAPPVLLTANGDAEFGSDSLWPFAIVGIALLDTVKSNCFHFAVVVTRVEFSDGTVWTSDPKQNQMLWRNSTRQENTSSCQDLSAVEGTIKQLQGASWSGPPPSHSGSDTTQSYAVACPVRRVNDGELRAVCTW